MGVRAAFLVLVACLAGCARKEPSPAASSSLSRDYAIAIAARVSQSVSPPLSFGEIYPTGSMRPAIDHKSIILYEPYKGQVLRVGDIVEYAIPGSSTRVLHRVIDVRANAVKTKGDANELDDGWIPLSRIYRKYVGQVVCST